MKFRPLPSAEYLRECVSADLDTGRLTWKERPAHHFATKGAWIVWNARWAGKPAFNSATAFRYLQGSIDGYNIFAHRVIWKLATGADPQEIDHIDGDPANNSLSNLRSVDRSDNMKNLAVRSDNASGYTGIFWDAERRKWKAYLSSKMLGRYEALDDAIAARKAALEANQYHANHGKRQRSKLLVEIA